MKSKEKLETHWSLRHTPQFKTKKNRNKAFTSWRSIEIQQIIIQRFLNDLKRTNPSKLIQTCNHLVKYITFLSWIILDSNSCPLKIDCIINMNQSRKYLLLPNEKLWRKLPWTTTCFRIINQNTHKKDQNLRLRKSSKLK